MKKVWKEQKKHILKEVFRYLDQNKYQIGMNEIKLTRNLRSQLNALLNAFSSISLNNIDFLDMSGKKINQELEYVNTLQDKMLL